jgi:hypothetical protein
MTDYVLAEMGSFGGRCADYSCSARDFHDGLSRLKQTNCVRQRPAEDLAQSGIGGVAASDPDDLRRRTVAADQKFEAASLVITTAPSRLAA